MPSPLENQSRRYARELFDKLRSTFNRSSSHTNIKEPVRQESEEPPSSVYESIFPEAVFSELKLHVGKDVRVVVLQDQYYFLGDNKAQHTEPWDEDHASNRQEITGTILAVHNNSLDLGNCTGTRISDLGDSYPIEPGNKSIPYNRRTFQYRSYSGNLSISEIFIDGLGIFNDLREKEIKAQEPIFIAKHVLPVQEIVVESLERVAQLGGWLPGSFIIRRDIDSSAGTFLCSWFLERAETLSSGVPTYRPDRAPVGWVKREFYWLGLQSSSDGSASFKTRDQQKPEASKDTLVAALQKAGPVVISRDHEDALRDQIDNF